MKVALFLAFVGLALALPSGRQVENLNNPDRVLGEFLIVLHRPANTDTRFQYATQVASKIVSLAPQITILKIFSNLLTPILYVKTTEDAVMSQLFQLDEVDIVEADVYQNLIQQCSSQSTGSRLWGLSRVSSRSAPNYSTATFSYSSGDGSGVRIYVLDTGTRITHEDFAGRSEWGNNFSNDGNDDRNGHGTHCSGTAMGSQYGVAKGATVVAVKVLGDSGSGQWAWSISGLDWMVGDISNRGVRGLASMSLGGGISSSVDAAVNSAVDAGNPVVVAAGNNNGNACNYSPARAEGAITVAASDNGDNLSSFSNWGTCVDIIAPGSSILSAWWTSDTATNTISGTSMACPHVAGLVANYLSANPNASPAQVKSYIASSTSKDMINLRGTTGTPNYLMYSSCA
jgi:subtilisin family serine protease